MEFVDVVNYCGFRILAHRQAADGTHEAT